MPFVRNLFGFVCGVATGVYIAQNYAVPDLRTVFDYAVRQAWIAIDIKV